MCLAVFAKGEKQTVVFDVDLHCQGCVTKIEKNIAFEKGVKDLICDLNKKQVTRPRLRPCRRLSVNWVNRPR